MFKKYNLKNGIRLVTSKMNGTKTVTVLVLVGTGSKYETKNISGISHFLEHMMFKGTKKRKDTKTITEELDSVGAEYNAFTSNEYTGYYVKADWTNLDLALDIVSDMLLNSKFRKKDMEKEKGVVIEEINMYKDNPQRQVAQNIDKLLFGDQPAGWDIAGTKKSVLSYTRKDLLKYFKDHYVSKNTVVCIAGNFNEKNIKQKVNKYFFSLQKGEPKQKKPTKQRQDSPRSLIEYKKTDQTHIVVALRSDLSLFSEKRFALILLANILGGNMSSRMFINIREKQGLAYYISAGTDFSTDTGYLYIRAGIDNKRVKDAVKSILAELKKVKTKGVTQKELKKAKEYFKGKTIMELESSDELAGFLGTQEILKNKIETQDELIKKVSKVKLSEVNTMAKKLFDNKNLNLALIGPFKQGDFDDVLKI